MARSVHNLYAGLPEPAIGEVFTGLLDRRDVRIERIVSSSSPDTKIYDQAEDEWVILLEGRATLDIAGETCELGPGDHLFIPAHTPHRVLDTMPRPRCIWLAVHLLPQDPD